jgi:hypothetical protein
MVPEYAFLRMQKAKEMHTRWLKPVMYDTADLHASNAHLNTCLEAYEEQYAHLTSFNRTSHFKRETV